MMQSFLRADEVGLLIGDHFDHTASPLRPGICSCGTGVPNIERHHVEGLGSFRLLCLNFSTDQ